MSINIVYADHKNPPQIMFKKNEHTVWMSNSNRDDMPNIAMNSYSAIKTKSNDSIFIAEPICVLEQNYNVQFLKSFKYIFTWATKCLAGTEVSSKVIYVNFPSYKNNPKIDISKWIPWEKRLDEIVFIANNKSSRHSSELYSLRIRLADWLHTNSKFKVSWYGNMPIHKPYYNGAISNKYDVLSKAKFSVCMENSYDPIYSANFLTEKLPDAWFAGTIPIYLGCSNLRELNVPNDCYFDFLPFRNNFDAFESRLKIFDADEYTKMTKEYSKLSDDLYRLTSYENMFDIMLSTYY